MLATVFLMQALGQATAYWVTLAVLRGLGHQLGLDENTTDPERARPAVDAIWRVIIGVGAFPALLAILLRRLLPESPRWLADHNNVEFAAAEAANVYGVEYQTVAGQQPPAQNQYHGAMMPQGRRHPPQQRSVLAGLQEYFSALFSYLGENHRWQCLRGVALSWCEFTQPLVGVPECGR
jgi:MFS transporter, PHS family, inorganic phosphate transporter